ncbi:MAG: sulfotransferase domain-containing protein [Chloroflexota bacterium]
MSNIVWLASYPKSGNTWARIFLNNYLLDGDAPADINNLEEGLHAGIRELFDRLTGVESSDLTPAEVNCIRPLMYQAWAAEADEPLIVKVHDAWRRNSDGQPIFPKAATKTAVYIIRNPLDIVASFANHYSQTIDETIQSMADSGYGLATSRHKLARQLPQFLGSWHHHVLSWVENPEMPVHLLRYEDMVHAPMPTFASLVEAIGLTVDHDRLAKAIRFSAFDQMKQQETAVGFKERLPGTSSFFRQGKQAAGKQNSPLHKLKPCAIIIMPSCKSLVI